MLDSSVENKHFVHCVEYNTMCHTKSKATRTSGQVHSLGITPEDRSVQYQSCNDKLNHAAGYWLMTAGLEINASVTEWVMNGYPPEAFRQYSETLRCPSGPGTPVRWAPRPTQMLVEVCSTWRTCRLHLNKCLFVCGRTVT